MTSNEPHSRGLLQCHTPLSFRTLELNIQWRIVSEQAVGGEGLAIWLSTAPITAGEFFGGSSFWDGLALVADSYDNNNDGNNPALGLVINNGKRAMPNGTDVWQLSHVRCPFDFRSAPIASVKILMRQNTVIIYTDDTAGSFGVCGQVGYQLPPRYFLAVTAATGSTDAGQSTPLI